MNDLLVEIVGILGFVSNVWANLLIARKSESGWAVRLIANALWLTYGIVIFSIANILSSVVFAWINVYGLRRWRRERLIATQHHLTGRCPTCDKIEPFRDPPRV